MHLLQRFSHLITWFFF